MANQLGNGDRLTVNSFGDVVNFVNNVLVKMPKPSTTIEAGKVRVIYNLYVKITIWWQMQGGSLTYGDVYPIFTALINRFPRDDPQSNHPVSVLITQGKNSKIALSTEKIRYEPFNVNSRTLIGQGQNYPTRQFPEADVNNIYEQAIKWCEKYSPQALIYEETNNYFESGDVQLSFLFERTSFTPILFPEFTYGDLKRLFKDLQLQGARGGRPCAYTMSLSVNVNGKQVFVGNTEVYEKSQPVLPKRQLGLELGGDVALGDAVGSTQAAVIQTF